MTVTKPMKGSIKTVSSSLKDTFGAPSPHLFLAILVMSVAPLWFGRYMPMVDLPQHAAQVAALHELSAGNVAFHEVFTANWFTPYLLGYVLLYAVSSVVPISIATKVVVTGSMIAVPLLTGSLLREVGADIRWRWLTIPGCYSFAFYWGFLSFMVAVPVAMIFLLWTIRFDRKPTLRRGAALAGLLLALFFCHVLALGFAGLVAVGYLFARNYKDLRAFVVRCIPLAAPVPLVALWFALTYDAESAVRESGVVYGQLGDRVLSLLAQPAGSDQLTIFAVLLTAVIVLLPLLAGSRLCREPARWAPVLVGLALFLVLVPKAGFNTGFLYQRLGIFLVPFWLMVWDQPGKPTSRFEFVGIIVVVIWLLPTTARFAAFARESESFAAIMERMVPGQTAAMMIVDRDSPLFGEPVYLHFPAWYQAEKQGIVDFSFADFHPQVVRYKPSRGPRLSERLAWAPWEFDWVAHGGPSYRYFVVKAPMDASQHLFKEHTSTVNFVARRGDWWLYENGAIR